MKKFLPIVLVLVLLIGIISGCSSGDVSDPLRKEIQEAYCKTFLSPTQAREYKFKNEDADTIADMQYYGTYNGYVILMRSGVLAVVSTVQIGPYVFQWGSGSLCLYAYKDGTFHNLKDVYEAGELSDVEISTIAAEHKAYFYTKHNWDYDIEVET